MAIAFSCEGCGKSFSVDDRLAGKRSRCKQCGHVFQIPGPSPAQPAPQRPARASDPAPPAFDPYAIDDAPPPSAPPGPEERLPERAGAPAPKKKKRRRADASPWLTIWFHPRDTVRAILDTDPSRGVMLLYFLAGINYTITRGYRPDTAGDLLVLRIIIGVLFFGAIWGAVSYCIAATILQVACGILGGRGDTEEVRVAVAWSSVPMLGNMAFWAVLIGMYGTEIFRASFGAAHGGEALVMVYAANFILSVWSFVLLVAALAEAQEFSVLRALGALLLSALIILLIVLLIGLVTVSIWRMR